MRTWLVAAALLLALSGCTAVVDGTGTVAGSALSGGGASPSDGTQTDSGSGQSGLVRFHGNGFSILLPGAPVRNDLPVRTAGGKVKVTLHVLTVELDDSDEYVFGYVDYPPSVFLTLEGALRGAAAKVGGVARGTKAITYRGAPGRDFRLETPTGLTAFNRFLIVNRRLYELELVQRHAGTVPPAQFGTIERSLRF